MEFLVIFLWNLFSFVVMLIFFNDLNCDIIRLMCKSLYVFGLDYSRVIENIYKFEIVGLLKDIIGKVVLVNFLILIFLLRDDVLEVVKFLLEVYNSI